jgi:hypothetical protein
MAERVYAPRRISGDRGGLQRKAPLRIGEPDDRFEREADRVADAVIRGRTASRPGLSVSRIPLAQVQRDNGEPKSEEEKYKEAAQKVGEAFLQTDVGKKLKEQAEQDPLVKGAKEAGESFIGTLPGKVITGAAAVGTVSALAATHKELPAQIPEIPLDKITPGLKVKIAYEGPVDQPTKAMITFSYTEQIAGGKKPAKTKTEIQREENARMAAELAKFRAGLRYAPGTPEAERQEEEEEALKRAVFSRVGKLPEFGKPKTLPVLGPSPLTPFPAPSYGFKPKPFSLLDEELKLKPLDEAGETKEEKKKEEGAAVQRKATAHHAAGSAPAVVRNALQTPGRPLDAATRADMEQRFGCDFGDVRVHTDAHAERSARAVSARAYTFGGEVVFAAGEYSPYTAEGRRLLAHELAHVVQQQGRQDAASAAPAIRRKVDERLQSPAEVLREALKGDDDDVRDLTTASQWPSVKLTAEEAATLLVLLLEGSTLDDDEIAGLAVLRKAIALRLLDDTLGKLSDKRRFRQLLDDYHGDEYRLLLDVLSKHIERLNIKAIYLDAFIAMWWVREHEERAIVVLLERTAANDLFALLTRKDRQKELRDAIDSDALSVRYEKIAGKVNELRQADLAAQLKKIFSAKAKTSQAAGKRTPDEVNRLLVAAADDLTNELLDYRDKLRKALAAREPDDDAIAEINKDFEARLGFLLERKQAEFDLELKYSVEFNRLLRDARGRSWTLADLKEIDKILAQIPPEILSANPRFRAIRRAGEDPKVAGQAPKSGAAIKLFGSLTLGTTAHELGHVISYDDGEKLQKEFNQQFGWEELSAADFTRLVPERKEREKLLGKLDDDRAKEREKKGDRHAHGKHFYRHDRYDKQGYLRHPKEACFISDYAATDRYDDFAESFEAYLTDPANLHEKCADKYAFMRGKVFVRYLFGKLAAGVLSDFDKERDEGLKGLALPVGLPGALRGGHLAKLREALEKELDATAGRLEARALGEKPSDKMKRVPLSGTEARDAAKPYRQRLTDLLGLLAHVVKPWQAFSSEVDQFAGAAPSKYHTSALLLRLQLLKSFREDALALIDPYAVRILAGEHIQLAAWPPMDALGAKYRKAAGVAAKYLPVHEASYLEDFQARTAAAFASTEEEEVGAVAWKILRRYPQGDPRRQKLKNYILQQRAELGKQTEKLRSEILEQVKAGVPPKQAKLTTPQSLLKAYERDIRDFIKREGLQLQRQADPAAAGGAAAAPLVEPTLHGPGTELPLHVRAGMERRFGYDFSRVRVHADTRAAAAAKSAGALAYTVGSHVVFAAGQYQPLGRTGRRLLAHELTHVVQQGAAPPLGRAAGAQERRLLRDAAAGTQQAGPAVDREIVDLPEPAEEETAEPQAAPPAAMPEARLPVAAPDHATEREAAQIAERIAREESEETLPHVAERLAPGNTVSRDNVPKPGQPVRKDIAFVMGSDKPKSKNRFYTAAKKYFKANLAGVELIDDPKIRDLAAVFSYLARRGEAVGTLYIISHAADDGTLSFPLQPGDKDRKVDYRELRDALKTSPGLFKLPEGLVDESTTVRIKGCRLGQSERMLGVIGAAFGAGRVIAPKHRQYYGYQTTAPGKGRKAEETTYEGFKTYFIERLGEASLTRDEQLDAFAVKYANLARADWETLVPKKGSKVARKVERREALSFSFTDPADDKQALAQAKKQFAASNEKFIPAKMVGSAETPKPFELTLSGGSKKTFKGKAVKYSFEDAKGDTGYLTYDVPADETEIVEAAKADESVPEAYDWSLQKTRAGATATYTVLGVRTVYSLDRYIVARLGREPEVKRLHAPPEAAPEYYGEAAKP